MLVALNSSREARRGVLVFTASSFFFPPPPPFFLSNFKYIFFMFASSVSAIKPGGSARADFTHTPSSIQQAGGVVGFSLVFSTHIFLGGVQKNIFQRLLAPKPSMLLILYLFKKKISFIISKEQSSRINNIGFNVIKSLKLNQSGLFSYTCAGK